MREVGCLATTNVYFQPRHEASKPEHHSLRRLQQKTMMCLAPAPAEPHKGLSNLTFETKLGALGITCCRSYTLTGHMIEWKILAYVGCSPAGSIPSNRS